MRPLSFLMGRKLLGQQRIYGGEQAPGRSAGPGSHSKSLRVYTFDNSSQAREGVRGQKHHFPALRSQQREQQGNKTMSQPASALFLIELWCGSGYVRGRQSEHTPSNVLSVSQLQKAGNSSWHCQKRVINTVLLGESDQKDGE